MVKLVQALLWIRDVLLNSVDDEVGFFLSFSAIFKRKMQKLPLFSCI